MPVTSKSRRALLLTNAAALAYQKFSKAIEPMISVFSASAAQPPRRVAMTLISAPLCKSAIFSKLSKSPEAIDRY